MSRILIIEDEDRIASFIKSGLESHGYQVDVVNDGIEALQWAKYSNPDLILLDIGLPGKSGIEILNELRGTGDNVPVIILTARDSVSDRVSGLELGANDYMSKPFAFEELLVRIRLRLKDSATQSVPSVNELTVGEITLNFHDRTVLFRGKKIELSGREFALLELFMRNPNRVLSREQLLSNVWDLDFDPNSNVVDVYVRYLRQKLDDDIIQTVRGMGYKFKA
ncbi:MAG: response regulator transcription factor [Candidatus Nanopelagicales bacterium]